MYCTCLYNVFICQGCPKRINSATRPPHDIFFWVKAIRPFEDKDTLIWKDRIANGYLHLDLKCLKNFDKDVNLEECRMTDEMFTNLSDAHMKVLADMGILKHIIANKSKDIEVSYASLVAPLVASFSIRKFMQRVVQHAVFLKHVRLNTTHCAFFHIWKNVQ